MLLLVCVTESVAQQPGLNGPREKVREIMREEMDRQLLLKPIPAIKDDSTRRAVLKQIKEDFRDIQGLNNKMMADTWAREEPDYGYIADMLAQIRGKATRLKANLSLPEASDSEKTDQHLTASGAKQFRAALLVLDHSIMSFVTNPLFKEDKVVQVSMATQASRDLETVVQLTSSIKKAASMLNKKSKDGH